MMYIFMKGAQSPVEYSGCKNGALVERVCLCKLQDGFCKRHTVCRTET